MKNFVTFLRFSKSIILPCLLLCTASQVANAHKGMNFHARIKSPANTYPTAAGLTATVQILDPVSNCVLREEEHSNINVNNGYVTLVVGASTASTATALNPSPVLSVEQAMDNSTTRTNLKCVTDATTNAFINGQTYNPSTSHGRKLRLRMNIQGQDLVADFSMKAVPFAVKSEDADKLQGFTADGFIKTSATVTQINIETIIAEIMANTFIAPSATTAASATVANNVTGTVAIANGGTGATSASAAITNLLPSQGGNAGKFLSTNGTTTSWSAPAAPDLSGITLAGDVTGPVGTTSVGKIQGVAVDTTSPALGQILRYSAGQWAPAMITLADLKSSAVSNPPLFASPACTATQTLSWNSGTDQFTCQSITNLSGSAFANTVGIWDSDGTNATRVSGNVGIGTANPDRTVHVYAPGAAATLRIEGTGGNEYATLELKSDEAVGKNWLISHRKDVPNSLMFSYHNGSTWSNKMVFAPDGKVGIGTVSPTTSLDVNSGYIRTGSGNGSSSGDGGRIYFGTSQTPNTGQYNQAYISAYTSHAGDDGSGTGTKGGLILATKNTTGATSATERMRIDADGNVGIGTTPNAKLHLAAGSTAIAPLKLTSGALTTTPQAGAMEYDGTSFYITNGTASRKVVATGTAAGTIDNASTITAPGNITLTPTGSVVVNSNTPSTSPSTGALIVNGGLGTSGNIYSSGAISAGTQITSPIVSGSAAPSGSLTLDSTTDSTKGTISFAPTGGNVGIGVAVPTAKFQIKGDSVANGNAQTNISAFTGNGINIQGSVPNSSQDAITWSSMGGGGAAIAFRRDNSYNTSMDFYTNNTAAGGAISRAVTIDSNGYVGIGTTVAPSARLDINQGAVRIGGKVGSAVMSATTLPVQGGYVTWNQTSGSGKTSFMNAPGAGAGGFDFNLFNAAGNYVSTPVTINGSGKLGVGTDAPVQTLHVMGNALFGSTTDFPSAFSGFNSASPESSVGILKHITDTTAGASSALSAYSTLAPQSDSSRSTIGLATGIASDIPAGVTHSQFAAGFYTMMTRNRYTGTTDSGNLATLHGALIYYGHEDGNPAAVPKTTTAVGVRIAPQFKSGTITNAYDLKIDSPNGSATTITDRWSIYQSDTSTKNYFGGSIGIVTGNPQAKFHVGQAFQSPFSIAQSSMVLGDTLTRATPSDSNYNGSITFFGKDAEHAFLTYRPNQLNGRSRMELVGFASAYGDRQIDFTASGRVGVGTSSTPAARLDVIDTGTTTSAIIVPRAPAFTGTTVNGMVRYNSTSNLFEFYQNGSWVNYTTVSDARLKTNITPVTQGLDIVTRLRPVFYDWDKTNNRTKSFDQKHQIGFVAQEVEKVIPEVVDIGEDSYRSVQYGKIVSVAVAAIKELYSKFLEHDHQLDQKVDKSELNLLKIENERLSLENREIKSYLCNKDPHASICR
ncbi:tail fiber domain-containing protein [Bdellovibrio bacteriovorus]|uniref:Putative cell wall surface anchor family protein n=1 Tax=Bdellovibrio bacteriovorus str. Tiberius TaxID=1069642 RepID=K7YT11_BDEBC|nr:tail fiber domain-containing protein [Bdellovibrio bacteriovorus]AFY00768.1 putative cell wall surface anchor family protein [Bdellovibrio bacteriovorus str. Tiberius]